jgi:hypothetical protein
VFLGHRNRLVADAGLYAVVVTVSGKRPNGRKRAGGSRERTGWTAAPAAYRAVQLRDEVLARYPSNPLAVLNEVAMKEDVINQWVQVYRQGGLREKDALRMAAVRCGHTAPLPPRTTIHALAELVTREAIERDVAALKWGEVFVVSPAMHAVAVAAAATVTEDDVAGPTEEDLQASEGLLLLPAVQLIQQPGRPFPDEILALSWMTRSIAEPHRPSIRALEVVAWFDCNGPVQVPDFVYARRLANQAGHPFPRIMPLHHSRFVLGEPASDLPSHPAVAEMLARAKAIQPTMNAEGVEVGEYHGGLIEVLAEDWVRAYLFAFLRLCAQQIAVTAPYRELRGADLPPRPADPVRVTQLRSFSELTHVPQEHHRSYQHRWIVRMHKVRQWYPSEGVHKIIWRGPYIKGSANAPLLTGERVNALVR